MSQAKSKIRTAAAKEGYRRSLANYSKVFYIELSSKEKTEIIGPVMFKTWIQAYRFLDRFIRTASDNTTTLKNLTKLGQIYKFGSWTLEIKWVKVT